MFVKSVSVSNLLAGVGLALAVMENFDSIKVLGLALLTLAVVWKLIFTRAAISRLFLKRLMILALPVLWTVILSVTCIDQSWSTLVKILAKLLIVSSFLLLLTDRELCQAIGFAITFHVCAWLIHLGMLLLGFGEVFDLVIGLDTQTQFAGVSWIPFRATGLFDEPSLFAMTIIGLLIVRYFLTGRIAINWPAVLSFSTPAILVSGMTRILASRHLNLVRLVSLLLVSVFLLVVLIEIIVQREGNLRFSPFMLRANQVIALAESESLMFGNGICQAYGKYDFYLDQEGLRNIGMGNYKDAGQLIFLVDRIGLIAFLIFVGILLATYPIRPLAVFFVYFALSKVIFYSAAGLFVLLALGRAGRRGEGDE